MSVGEGLWLTALTGVAVVSALWDGRPPAQRPAAGPITVVAQPVPLDTRDPSRTAIGDFVYAGGLALTSPDTSRLHGLSDLEVSGGDSLIAVTDFGSVVEARLLFDQETRLVGLADAQIAPLVDTTGQPLLNKADADAEGLALLPSGDRLVSFEERDRIWLYPAAGGVPRAVPMPPGPLVFNLGMEALGADPDAGSDAYVVGIELTGETWSCRLSETACSPGPVVPKSQEFGLVAMKRLPGGRTAYLLRAFDVVRGNRIALVIERASSVVARLDMAAPLTVDDFEGLAGVARTDGGVRFYLVSDDNDSARQRTLLLAFDWRPR